MRAAKEMTHHSGVLGLGAEIVADPDNAGGLFGRFASKINGSEADCVWLSRTGARSHDPHSAAP
jgi:hypothetical protein